AHSRILRLPPGAPSRLARLAGGSPPPVRPRTRKWPDGGGDASHPVPPRGGRVIVARVGGAPQDDDRPPARVSGARGRNVRKTSPEEPAPSVSHATAAATPSQQPSGPAA